MIYIQILCIAVVSVLAYISIQTFNKTREGIDRHDNKIYLNELDKMIEMFTIFEVDNIVGGTFREKKAISADISNDEIINAISDIGVEILSTMGVRMKEHLYSTYGDVWIHKYIKMKVTTILVAYVTDRISELK